MKQEYTFNLFNEYVTVTLYSLATVLRNEENLPTVFLLDENHDNINNCIDKNVDNAMELIAKANVRIVGVESLAGGKEWDRETQKYAENNYNEKWYEESVKLYKNSCTHFANEVKALYPGYVVGVESIGMMNRVADDYSNNLHRKETGRHALMATRSAHFIKTLFEQYSSKSDSYNLILNCGSEHNTDIENWINSGEIDEIAGTKANYIRINSINN